MVSLSFIGLSLAVTALAAQTVEAAATPKHHVSTIASSHKHQTHQKNTKKHVQSHKRSTSKHTKKTTKKHSKKSTTKASGSGSSSLSADQKTILDAHNAYRAKHSAPPLKWSTKLADYAQKWTNNCEFQHSGGPYGENLALGYADWKSAINGWYGEAKDYDYKNPGFSGSTGHFTQIVWVGTTEIGCGVKQCSNLMGGAPLYTCSYNPPGNYIGEFEKNVLPN